MTPIHDLLTAGLALVAMIGIIALTALSQPVPDVLPGVLTLGFGYLVRGAVNGGLLTKKDGGAG